MERNEQRALIESIQKKIDIQSQDPEIDPIDILASELGVSHHIVLATQAENKAHSIGRKIFLSLGVGFIGILVTGYSLLGSHKILTIAGITGISASVLASITIFIQKSEYLEKAEKHMTFDLLDKERAAVLSKMSHDLGIDKEEATILRGQVEYYLLWRFDKEVLAPEKKVILGEDGVPKVVNNSLPI